MSGIIRYGSYIPYFRLKKSAFGAGRGERAVASYDEDSVSMAVEAARDALRGACIPDSLIFATTSPPYAEKLNSATIAAALDLPGETRSLELGACSRMGLSGLILGLDLARSGEATLVCAADVVIGAPGGARESGSGDAAAVFLTGKNEDSIAVLKGRASATTELIDVWRLPGDQFARQWEERFGADVLSPVMMDAITRALKQAGVQASELNRVIVDSANPRVTAAVPRAMKLTPEQYSNPLQNTVGRSGTANIGLQLAFTLDSARPGDLLLLISAVDGCDVLVLEVTENIHAGRPQRTVEQWLASKSADLDYHSYLKWRGIMPFEPPRRPEPERPAAPASVRSGRWKMAFVGGRCQVCDKVNLPAQRVCVKCGAIDKMREEPYADALGRVATYTLDHLAYSLQPPVVAAVVDYEQGGRLSCELTDVKPTDVGIGTELEMTFRRLYTGQGIHNYFWKARPKR
ncbi:MAG: OB-fold domain-containing protein [Proteobacteria bacterium]|nr:OB-fold domain-containing protein [Pseudomonadota bacterium]